MVGVVNLKWRVAMSLLGVNFTKAEQDKGWPDALIPGQLAALQYPYMKGDRVAYKLAGDRAKDIEDACLNGSIQFTQATRQTKYQITKLVPGDARFATRNVYGEREANFRQQLTWASREVQVNHITAPAFAAWLAAQGETPSVHIQAWFDAVGVAGTAQAAPVANNALPTPQTPAKQNKRRDLLAPLVEAAQKACQDSNDAAAVFTKLKTWAQENKPRAPLLGVTGDGRIQWCDSNDTPQELNKKALAKRLARQQKTPATTPPGKQLRRIK